MYNEQELINKIIDMFEPDFKPFYDISVKENKGAANSIVIDCRGTYFHDAIKGALFARIQINGATPYISFNDKYESLFKVAEIPFYKAKSDIGFLRIDLNIFYSYINEPEILSPILRIIFMDLFSFTPFGCCDRFEKCSDERKCIHSDLIYATACQYRKNLVAGRIFYGRNRNIAY
ncbi:MAG: hypothetical protein GXY40_06715 [Syntrophomonadaceae bacterium]|jgi:hypothetical protein|nr:hypothetical protein [Syntrophomonadaceae bacterium]